MDVVSVVVVVDRQGSPGQEQIGFSVTKNLKQYCADCEFLLKHRCCNQFLMNYNKDKNLSIAIEHIT